MIYLNQNVKIDNFFHGERNYFFTKDGELNPLSKCLKIISLK